jgi:hypothetical protein
MATSGTHTFGLTAASVLDEGFERIGWNPSSLSAEHLNSGLRSLNLVLREIENRAGVQFLDDWVMVSLAAGEKAAALPAGTIEVRQASVLQSATNEMPLTRIGRAIWQRYPDKTQTGLPANFFVDHQRPPDDTLFPELAATDAPAIVVWPAANQAYTLRIWRLRMMEDAGGLSNDVDVRPRYFEAICAGLAYRLSAKYAPERARPLKAEFLEQLDWATAGENREGIIVIGYDRSGPRRRRR